MSSGIVLTDRQEYRGTPAWHMEGNVFKLDDPRSLSEIAERHFSDIKTYKVPVFGQVASNYVPLPGEYALMRKPIDEDPETRFWGLVKKGWKPVDPLKIVRHLDELSKTYPVETLGVLGYGETLYLSLRDKPLKVGVPGYWEEIHGHFVLQIEMTPGKSSAAFQTRTRPVCVNTLHIGWKNSDHRLKIPHTMNPEEAMAWLIDVFAFAEREREFQENTLNVFCKTPLIFGSEDFEQVLKDMFKDPKPSARMTRYARMAAKKHVPNLGQSVLDKIDQDEANFDRQSDKVRAYRECVRELVQKFNDEFSHVANTTYATFNALTEMSTHRVVHGREEINGRSYEQSLLFGPRAKEIREGFGVLEKHAMSVSN